MIVGARARAARSAARDPGPPGYRWWRDHRTFLIILAAGCALRLIAMLGIQPIIAPPGDSYTYLSDALAFRPSGYAVFLRLLEPAHSLTVVALVQHVMGVLAGVLVYLMLCRSGLPRWAAALSAAPCLLDAYQLELEHLLLADVLFTLLLLAAVTILVLSDDLGPWTMVLAGLLLSAAALIRSAGLPLLALAGLYLLLRRIPRRSLLVLATVCALPLAAFAIWFHAWYGDFSLTQRSGLLLWSRTMSFADCSKFRPVGMERLLCTAAPPEDRPPPTTFLLGRDSPLSRLPGQRFSAANDGIAHDFAVRAILAQPGDYLDTVLHGTGRAFTWDRRSYPSRAVVATYSFGYREPVRLYQSKRSPEYSLLAGYSQGRPEPWRVVQPYAGFLRVYQVAFYLPGALLAVLLLLSVPALFNRRTWVLPATALALIVIPVATEDFDYRYTLSAIPFACMAAAHGARAMLRRCS